ncbi:MAG: TrkA family potassium uptake protein [Nitrospinae bacterium]|nr:TrkA family potassium uptake protein [Nitrospinota bacterium]
MKNRTFGVIGLGRFGYHMAKTLAEGGAEVIAVDNDEGVVREVGEFVTEAYALDATDEKALKESGIIEADTVIVSIGEKVDASFLVVALLLGLGVKDIIAKGINPLHGKALLKMGVRKVVFPEMDSAVRAAHSLLVTGLSNEIIFAPGHSIYEIEAPAAMKGRTLADLDLRARFNLNVLLIKHKDGGVKSPGPGDMIQDGDSLLAMGDPKSLLKMEDDL